MALVEQQLADDQRLYLWLRHQFTLLGFNRHQASKLAELHADWHQAQGLLEHGCPVEIAFDLLS